MPTASEKAKAKLQAVLDADRQDRSNRNNRIATTRYPAGGSEVTNRMDYPNRRGSTGGLRGAIKDMLNRPAY
ncbi:hypothetical protein M406DRAFT_355366 [Cryphonectria parasitica EP155]|uniref:Uncharacterized protein n=1 Tax=Cryphonectria parasitica (strain ATCC 38755 / EP155) TaxID=660469 RepID=A0A9P4Y517_CRYP1|nr:uncharacterized protein M406DRAFT_355366 [Cryphonectria parasitica EP155]KAF3766801.1 hypothetical protein M406DRAFT_355366 [Cryphonectria parasitica EP155]